MRITVQDHVIDCTQRTAVMAVLNLGTDSPVAASVVDPSDAVRRAAALRDAGASIIDLGAHSTRTGGETVGQEQEIARLCPVVEALRREGHLISVDTWTGAVARAVAQAGAHILNDVTAASDPETVRVASEYRMPLIVMHMRGRPKLHRKASQQYDDVAHEVREFLTEQAATLAATGVPDVWLDPGFEFAKSRDDNIRMLLDLPNLLALGRPIVISASRKGFLAELLGHPKLASADAQAVPGILEATIAFNVLAAYLGAHILRVHDVAAVAAAIAVVDRVRAAGTVGPPRPGAIH